MRRITFDCYRIGNSLPLSALRAFLGMKETPRRREYILLEGESLAQVLKYERENQAAYLYHYGCAVFVNCSTDEMRSMLHFIVSGFCSGSAGSYYHESFSIEADDENHYCLFEDASERLPLDRFVVPTLASALAKLTALAVMEEEIGKTYDDAETFIAYMGRGRVNLKAKRYAAEVARIVRFQYNSAYTVRIFERCVTSRRRISERAGCTMRLWRIMNTASASTRCARRSARWRISSAYSSR